MSLSNRDWDARRERMRFVQEEQERERLAQDQDEYAKFCKRFENEQRSVPPAYRVDVPTFEEFRRYMPQDQPDAAIRGLLAGNALLLERTAAIERQVVEHGDPDPGFQLPHSAIGKKASYEQAKQINGAEFARFKGKNPELYLSSANVDRLIDYLLAQGINIATAECYESAWNRLAALRLLEERPEPEPQPEHHPEAEQTVIDDGSMMGVIPETGEPQRYTAYEIRLMDSDWFKRCFQLTTERREQLFKTLP